MVVRVWDPEKVFKFYLSRCWEKGFISCHQHVTISSFERFFFSRWKDSSFPAPGWEDSLFPGAGSRSRRRVSLPAPALLPAPAEAFLLSQCGVEAFFSCWQKNQQPRRHTVCLLLSSGRQSLHSLLTAPGWRGERFDSTMTPGYSKFKAQISFSVKRCISAMRWRIIKEQQRCWLLLAFRFRAYTPAYRFLRSLLLCRQQTDAYPAILKMYLVRGMYASKYSLTVAPAPRRGWNKFRPLQAPGANFQCKFSILKTYEITSHSPDGLAPPTAPLKGLAAAFLRMPRSSSLLVQDSNLPPKAPNEPFPPKAPMKPFHPKPRWKITRKNGKKKTAKKKVLFSFLERA